MQKIVHFYFRWETFSKSPERLFLIEKIRILFAGVGVAFELFNTHHFLPWLNVAKATIETQKWNYPANIPPENRKLSKNSQQNHRKFSFLIFSFIKFLDFYIFSYFFLGFSTSSSSSSTLYATSYIFSFYLIHARFPLHLCITRSLNEDWSVCSVARQFLLRIARKFTFSCQVYSERSLEVEKIIFLTLFALRSVFVQNAGQLWREYLSMKSAVSRMQHKQMFLFRCYMCEEEMQTKPKNPNNRSSSDQRRWKIPPNLFIVLSNLWPKFFSRFKHF